MKISEGWSANVILFFEWSLYSIVITMPFNMLACTISIIVAFVLSVVIFLNTKTFHSSISLLPIAFFALLALSVLFSKNIPWAISSFELNSSYLFIPLLLALAGSIITDKLRDRLLMTFSVSVLLVCFISYVRIAIHTHHFFPSSSGESYSYYEPFSRYAFSEFINNIHPTYLSMYLLLVTVAVFEKFQLKNIWKIVLTGWVILFLLILSSKNQVIVFFAIISILTWKHTHLPTLLKVVLVSAMILILTLIGARNDQIRYRFETEISKTLGDRNILWSEGVEIISENWWAGVGVGDTRDELNARLKKDHADLINFNLHNQYLEFALSLGVIGLLLFLSLLFIPFVRNADLTFCLFIFIVATASFTESILLRQKGLMFFLVFYGLLGLPYRLQGKKTPS